MEEKGKRGKGKETGEGRGGEGDRGKEDRGGRLEKEGEGRK